MLTYLKSIVLYVLRRLLFVLIDFRKWLASLILVEKDFSQLMENNHLNRILLYPATCVCTQN